MMQASFREAVMNLRQALAAALRATRVRHSLTQEDFSDGSSRTYLSALERGIKSPTLEKIDQLAGVLGVEPAALVLAAYGLQARDSDKFFGQALKQAREIVDAAAALEPASRIRAKPARRR